MICQNATVVIYKKKRLHESKVNDHTCQLSGT